MRRAVIAPSVFLVALSGAPLHAQSLPAKAAVARVADSLANAFLAAKESPSVAIAVIRGADTLVFGAWGKADLENDVAATPTSVYRIGSVTKQFTSAAVMQLVEKGLVKLDAPIGTYLATLPAEWKPVTVRQLLNHTSGIPSYTDIGEAWARRWGEIMTPDTLVALTAGKKMDFAPGTSWHYNNTGYVLLGMLIEKVTGHAWGTELADRFFTPLGLTATRNCLNEPLVTHRAAGYQKAANGWSNAQYLAMSQPYSAGAMCSTIGDLATWNRALHGGKVVSAESYKLMTTPEGAAATAALKYGFGLGRDTLAGHPIVTHGGGIHGFITGNAWVPELALSVTVLTNSGDAKADQLLAQLVRAAAGAPLKQPPKAVAATAAQRAHVVGKYALNLGGTVREFSVFEREGALYGQLEGQSAIPLNFLGNDTWGASFDASLRLIFDAAGTTASTMTLKQGGGEFTGQRKP